MYLCSGMSKKLIIIVSVFLSLALVGLIAMQTLWINNAFKVKENHFNQLVHKALTEAVTNIQRNETMSFIFDEMGSFYVDSTIYGSDEDFHFDTTINLETNDPSGDYVSQQLQISHESHSGNVKTNITVSSKSRNNNTDNPTNDTASQNKDTDRKNLVDQVVNQMFSMSPGAHGYIKPELIKKFVEKALIRQGIKTGFEFAVNKWGDHVAFCSKGFKPDKRTELYHVQLTPDDIFDNTNILSIYFPNRRNFIISSLGFMSVSSSFLTLFLLVTYAFTLYVILRQKRLSEMKSDFVNNMTHELKTPISTISLASQMLSDKSITPADKNYDRISTIITEESRRLGYQVERVLQMAKFDQGDLKLHFKNVSVHEIIESVISNFILQVESKEGVLIPSLHAENDQIKADPIHLSNVISNLLDNAVKYTPEHPEIYIETRNIEQFLQITVRDNGIGISKSHQRRIFDKFYRVSTGNIHNVKGFGLGLSYVKKIMQEHQGVINVESEPGTGSIFIVKLPLKNQIL
jgi:two-component system phosphate regulon sensor histidine kinase PhoR